MAGTIPHNLRGLADGKLYLRVLELIDSINRCLERKPVILKEANINFVLDFLKEHIKKVDGIAVLDCASIPEKIAIAGKFAHINRDSEVYDIIFANPVGVTRFLTEQLAYLGRESTLKHYAQLLKETLGARSFIKISTIDLTVHKHGVDVIDFLSSLNLQEIFEQINQLTQQPKRGSILITSDHGYDLVADEYGLYIIHGYRGKCPLNFSRISIFIVIN